MSVTLYNHVEILNYFNDSGNVNKIKSISYKKNKYVLHEDIIILNQNSVTIVLTNNQIFDGNGHTIIHNIPRDGLFLNTK